jgi:hypothetical protein
LTGHHQRGQPSVTVVFGSWKLEMLAAVRAPCATPTCAAFDFPRGQSFGLFRDDDDDDDDNMYSSSCHTCVGNHLLLVFVCVCDAAGLSSIEI